MRSKDRSYKRPTQPYFRESGHLYTLQVLAASAHQPIDPPQAELSGAVGTFARTFPSSIRAGPARLG
jgi:hypothetical protein